MQTTSTVRVGNISDLATEREVTEFFSFSGEIQAIEILPASEPGKLRTAFVTFKDPRALEIALLLSGATIIDQIVTITAVENYIPKVEQEERAMELLGTDSTLEASIQNLEGRNTPSTSGRLNIGKAQEVVTSLLAKGSAIKQDAVNKAKAFDEKHQFRANASAKVLSFDRRVGLSEKITVGISVVNEKVKSVDQKLHVSDKTMAVITVAERKLNDTGSAVKTNRYVTAGTSWLNGAFSKVAKVGHAAGNKTREKFQLAVSNLTMKEPVVAA